MKVKSDESGDDLVAPPTGSNEQSPDMMEPMVSTDSDGRATEDSPSGDASPNRDEKLKKEQFDEQALLEQYDLFCAKMRSILEQMSGFTVSDVGLSFDDFSAMLDQYGLTSADQLLAESDMLKFVYQVGARAHRGDLLLLKQTGLPVKQE